MKTFIDATAAYITNMLEGAKKEDFLDQPIEDFAGLALSLCAVSLFERYRQIDEANKQGVLPIWGRP